MLNKFQFFRFGQEWRLCCVYILQAGEEKLIWIVFSQSIICAGSLHYGCEKLTAFATCLKESFTPVARNSYSSDKVFPVTVGSSEFKEKLAPSAANLKARTSHTSGCEWNQGLFHSSSISPWHKLNIELFTHWTQCMRVGSLATSDGTEPVTILDHGQHSKCTCDSNNLTWTIW